MKTLGLLGGMSRESTVPSYRLLNEAGASLARTATLRERVALIAARFRDIAAIGCADNKAACILWPLLERGGS
ncbi:MAG TPA: hypothetical protein VMT49_08815 [Steroidobacteraceae bacterium]|nr:hypothetical protein [Steroidobacteraceae bacterium]